MAACGIGIVCYNFMPVVDWTRTDLDFVTPTGATAMRFDHERFAAFDLFVLEGWGGSGLFDTGPGACRDGLREMSQDEIDEITHIITSALPGSTTDPLTIPGFRERLGTYRGIDLAKLRQHLVEFLEAVTPAAEARGVKLTLHPDDPPRLALRPAAAHRLDGAGLCRALRGGASPANGMLLHG